MKRLISVNPTATEAPDLRVGDYVLISRTRTGPRLWDHSYRASLTNRGTTDLGGAAADLRGLFDTLVVDGRLGSGRSRPGRP